MLLGRFAGKMDGDLKSSRFGVGTAATAFNDPALAGSHLQVAATWLMPRGWRKDGE
jgi:hypothetical protein